MPLATQAKLLRVLQNREVQRVGALNARKVDVRVIAATNHDLRALISQKRFREDLYYRLSMVEIRMPRLAQRIEDLPMLQRHFIAHFGTEFNKEIHGLTRAAQIRLSQHSWPGNIRELENVIGHGAMMATSEMIDTTDLPPYLGVDSARQEYEMGVSSLRPDALEEHERTLLIRALEASGGNHTKAAHALRIGRDALRYKLRKHNLQSLDLLRSQAAAAG